MVKDKEKEKKVKVSDKEAENLIIDYLEKQNRPYSAIMLFENLHGAVGKTQAVKVLQDLAERSIITSKEFGKQKLFWRKQEELPGFDTETLSKLDEQIRQLEEEVSQLNDNCKVLSNELRILQTTPTDDEANKRIQKLKSENMELSKKVETIKQNQGMITIEDKKEAEKNYEFMRQMWKRRKRQCRDISGHIEEGTGKRFKELKEGLGLEVDEDYGVSFDQDEVSKLKRGEF